jgi:hypothetical protein
MHGIARHTKTENPEHQGGEHIAFSGHAQPFRVGGGLLDAVEQVEQADDDHQAGVLEQRNKGVDDAGDHQLQGLRQITRPMLRQ